jgi:ABC-2 type transport system ATP-binding protein
MIDIDHMTKRYGPAVGVQDITFTCAPGTVTGFLGPNGAGKSTSLRVLCGLATPTSGTATIAGVPYAQLPQPGRTVGVLLDASAQHAGRTGAESLRIAAQLLGVPRRRVERILDLVGLDGAAGGRRIGQYSLGMRQRLGLAHALLGDPQVLVLDEPANGLDPAGIHWMRGLLRSFADHGGTVLLSSHLLREVEAVADQLIIIGGGRVLAQGTADQLLHGQGVVAKATDPARLASSLNGAGLTYRSDPDGRFAVDARTEDVGRAAMAGGVILTELREPDGAGLEDLFLSLTSNEASTPGEASDPTFTVKEPA